MFNNIKSFCFPWQVVGNDMLVKIVQKTVNRSISERLFSRPWEPLKKEKIILESVPSREVIVDTQRMIIYCHPSVKSEIEENIKGVSHD